MHIVVAYDVPDDKRRNRIANVLLDYGMRIQESVYECDLPSDKFAKLKQRLAKLLKPAEDSLCIYHLCAACATRTERQGPARTKYEASREMII
ncbi:MAG: CRISPR-associated endonuclease Cas2 [Armatimonadota bacterium]